MNIMDFGIDLGPTSVGHTVVIQDLNTGRRFMPSESAMGVRIFPDSVNPKNQEPKNKKRRETRLTRRQFKRRKQRRSGLNQLLTMLGMLPSFNKDKDSEWHNIMRTNPTALRVKGLTEELSPYEFGRAIYHLSKRRHFKGRDITDNNCANDEDKEAKNSRDKLSQELNNSGETLGTYLFNKDFISKKGKPATEKQRGHHATREVVIDEFNQLWDAQQKFNPELLNPNARSSVFEAIFKQRPVFWRTSRLGRCSLVPDADLCARGTWLSHQRRMLEKINNLSVVNPEHRPLDNEEREIILTALSKQKTMSWAGIRKVLAPLYKKRGQKDAQKKIRFNYEASTINKEKAINGNPLEVSLQKIFSKQWDDENLRSFFRDHIDLLRLADFRQVPSNKAQRIELISAKEKSENRRQVIDTVFSQYNLNEQTKLKLLELNFESGWEPYSTDALKIILKELEKGTKMGELINSPLWEQWRDEKFPLRDQPTGEFKDLLPSPADKEEADIIKNIRNPTVVRVRNEVRKVINNLIRIHGKPDTIRIEVARDIGHSAAKRAETTRINNKNNAQREKARKNLIENGIPNPSRKDIEKWLLWEECDNTCLYSGKNISFDDLFRKGKFEVEHILPRSQTLDDSFLNKTLCLNKINQQKGGKTPYEAFGMNQELWNEMCDRVNASKLHSSKKRKFQMKTIPEGFSNRHLSDTSYAATEIVKSLKRLWPDVGITSNVHVETVSGRLTSQLRHLWGLNDILSEENIKNRDNHKHHAIDALVVACADTSTRQRLSKYWKQKDCNIHSQKPLLPLPWDDIRRDAEFHLSKMTVSHKVRSKISGALHEESYFGHSGVDADGNHYFTHRKPVKDLTASDIKHIKDAKIKEIIQKQVDAYDGDIKKALSNPVYISSMGSKITKVRVCRTRDKSLLVPLKNSFAMAGANHHVAIYKTKTGEFSYDVVSLHEASRRKVNQEKIIRKTLEDGSKIVLALHKGDTVQALAGDHKGTWVVSSVTSDGKVHFDGINDASKNPKKWKPSVNTLLTKHNIKKISVDPIGRISKCGF